MSAPPPPIDIVTVAITLATLLFGHDVAMVVGPYSVIVLGASLGGGWSTARLDPKDSRSTYGHMAMMICLALLITVPLSYLGEHYFGFESKWFLGPVAVVIAGIGQDWPRIAAWALGLLRSFIERWSNNKGAQP